MNYLIDTSVWIAFFKKGSTIDLKKLVRPHELYITLPIYQEVMQGIRDEHVFRSVGEALKSANFVENPMAADLYEEAISIFRLCRKNGVTIRSSVDCLIAAAAIRNNLTVIHQDRDFGHIARVTALKVKEIR